MRTAFPILVLLTLLSTGCERSPAPGASEAPDGDSLEGTLDVLTLNRLQGSADAIPCNPGDLAVLPAAAELRDRLRAEGHAALLVALGDGVNRSYKGGHGKAAELAIRARSLNVLEALAAAGVDAYVPSHGDFAIGLDELLSECLRLGIPVLLSNLVAAAHPEIRQSMLVQAGTLKVGFLAVIPGKVDDATAPDDPDATDPVAMDASYDGVMMLPISDTVRRLADGLRDEQGADLVVVLSSLTEKTNNSFTKIDSVDVVIGTLDSTFAADHIVLNGKTALMSSLPAGREVGHTTLAVRDGNLQLADLSPLHSLPGQIEQGRARLAEYQQRFQTDDVALLSRRVAPGAEESFLKFVQLLDENTEFVRAHQSYADSFIDHRPATLTPPARDNAALKVLDRQAAEVEAAVLGANLKPPLALEDKSAIPQSETCQSCHAAQFNFWAETKHARAYETLVTLRRQHEVGCLECHTAGFNVSFGWADPRLDAPYGAVTCFQCHAAYSYHSSSPRQVVDPLFVHSDPERMNCAECHVSRRSPGFDKETLLPAVACPPLRNDEPALLLARQRALDTISARRSKGIDEARDAYLEARALVGLGDFEKGFAMLQDYALGNPDDAPLAVEIARLLDESGGSAGAARLLEEYLGRHSGDPLVNAAYIKLLLYAKDQSVRNPEAAVTRLKLLLPDAPGESRKANLDFRVLQIDALFEARRDAEGVALINELAPEHGDDPRLQERIRKYMNQ